ncbi:MAG: efflux RND transporter periplasmic adaptor subunit [Paracraurococcus sp.]
MDSLHDLGAAPRTRSRRGLLGLGATAAVAGAGGYLLGQRAAPVPATPEAGGAASAPALPDTVTLPPEAARNFGLRTAVAEQRPLQRQVRVTGSVGFNELKLAHINPLARGRVQAIEVAIGDRVRTGQRLAVLDALDLAEARHQLAGAEASLVQAKAETQTARAAFNRAQELVRSGSVAQSELERRRADLARADATVLTRQTEVEHWGEMLSRYSPAATGTAPDGVSLRTPTPSDARGGILAPFDGAILAIGATPGELVDTGREIFTLADLSTVWVMADVPERELGAVKPGAAVSIAVEAYPGRRFPGRVGYVADQLDARTGTAKVRCEIPNLDGALKVNMFAIVEIAAPLGRDGVVVPDAALQTVDNQPVVFVRQAEDRFLRRDIRPGQRQDGLTEIAEGLQPGEVVATEGSIRLKAVLLQSRTDAHD